MPLRLKWSATDPLTSTSRAMGRNSANPIHPISDSRPVMSNACFNNAVDCRAMPEYKIALLISNVRTGLYCQTSRLVSAGVTWGVVAGVDTATGTITARATQGLMGSIATDTRWMDATEQAALVNRGDVSAEELIDAAIERIESLDGSINAVTIRWLDEARAAAPQLPDGPFRGVPFLLKDLWAHYAGQPLTNGCKALKDALPRSATDTTLVGRFRSAGLNIAGRTNSPEFGSLPTTEPGGWGPTHTPWTLDHTPGGSSGGSAAAVAAGMVPFAHASDGGGSIRIPAACCGLVGLKLSRGRTSVGPASDELARPLSVQFAVTRSVRDAAALLDAVAGPEIGDPVGPAAPASRYASQVNIEPAPLRIGLMTTMPGTADPADRECVAAAERTARVLDAAGHHVERAYPAAFDETERMTAFIPIWSAMAAANLIAIARRTGRDVTPDDVEPLTWFLAERGRETTGGELLDALSAMGQ